MRQTLKLHIVTWDERLTILDALMLLGRSGLPSARSLVLIH